jgi:hypothetical protein
MRVIDIDPALLHAYAAASIHSSREAWTHMEAEYAGNIDGLMETLVSQGPYAYTIVPQVFEDGSVKSPIISTFDGIRECYKFVRGRSDMISAEPLVEINGGWYNFQEDAAGEAGHGAGTGRAATGRRGRASPAPRAAQPVSGRTARKRRRSRSRYDERRRSGQYP